MFDFNGKTALVTGASRGIGARIAKLFASCGAKVYINYRENEKAALEIQKEITDQGGRANTLQADVTNKMQVDRMFRHLENQGPAPLDILVNAAGTAHVSPFMKLSEEQWDSDMDTNCKGIMLCSQAALKVFRRGAKIVNISSISAIKMECNYASYAVSKAAVITLTKALAKELGHRLITVNAVVPGPVQQACEPLSPYAERFVRKSIPLQRLGTREDTANAVAFLCSSLADYITGQSLIVDGGLTL